MERRIVVAGCRDYTNYEEAKTYINMCIGNIRQKFTLIFVSGGCVGADLLGERYAKENGFSIERYPAEWDKYGLRAGPIRNETMARIGDYIICFWDGQSRGTRSMIEYARKFDKPLRIKYIFPCQP